MLKESKGSCWNIYICLESWHEMTGDENNDFDIAVMVLYNSHFVQFSVHSTWLTWKYQQFENPKLLQQWVHLFVDKAKIQYPFNFNRYHEFNYRIYIISIVSIVTIMHEYDYLWSSYETAYSYFGDKCVIDISMVSEHNMSSGLRVTLSMTSQAYISVAQSQ